MHCVQRLRSRFARIAIAGCFTCLALPAAAGALNCPTLDLTCDFLACRSPAFGAPSELWGDLKPVDEGQLPANRDNTNFNPIVGPYAVTEPRWMSIDVEGNTLFAAINFGLQVWNVGGSNAANPEQLRVVGRNEFPYWAPGFSEEKNPVRDVDAPEGNDSVLAVALVNDSGPNVFDTSDPASPVAKYADQDRNALQVHAQRIGSNDYAFVATRDAGFLSYDLTAAQNLPLHCVDNTPLLQSCGVYVGRLGTRLATSYVHGTGNYVVVSGGVLEEGFEIWSVANPSSPSRILDGLPTEFVHGVTLWQAGGTYYLGLVANASGGNIDVRIYRLDCLARGSCGGLGSPIWSQNLPGGGVEFFLTFSRSGSRNFLFLGTVNVCTDRLQNEWLFDVTNPNSPTDITPPPAIVDGDLTGYWGWYYRRSPTGFNNTAGRAGVFKGSYFYRAAFSLFDVHQLTESSTPLFSDGFETGTLAAWSAVVQ